MNDWHERAGHLAGHLDGLGVLDPGWRAAFESVPRHLFVSSFYADNGDVVTGDDPATREQWLTAVYQDDSLVTQMAVVPGTDMRWPTSSSTRPSLMARMLGLLNLADQHTVLEIGTGTGYNAALLCHRLGAERVASIDIDPDLVQRAAARLAKAGYHPYLTTGDGAAGIPGRAPYDRIIATCAIPAIPAAWIAQLRPNGVIVADVRGELSSSLIVLTKTDHTTVQGRFLAVPGHFMWLRTQPDNPLRAGGEFNTVINTDDAHTSSTDLDPAILDNPEFQFMMTLLVPGLVSAGYVDRDGGRVRVVRAGDGSWVEIEATSSDGYQATQSGTRHIWDEIVAAAGGWDDLGQPDRSRFGLTATATDHIVWLDTPSHVTMT